jgi:hypothetical protein
VEANGPLPISVPRAKGFDMGIVAVLEKPEHVASYAVHPAHLEYDRHLRYESRLRRPISCRITNYLLRVHKLREELCDDTLAYDLEF